MLYEKKPETIEAVQYNGQDIQDVVTNTTKDEKRHKGKAGSTVNLQPNQTILDTELGLANISIGDYIVTLSAGHKVVYGKDFFEKTWQPIK